MKCALVGEDEWSTIGCHLREAMNNICLSCFCQVIMDAFLSEGLAFQTITGLLSSSSMRPGIRISLIRRNLVK